MKPSKVRQVSRFLRHRFSRVRPVEVQACLSNECNMKCQYCACPTLPRNDLPTEEWLNIIRCLRRHGVLRLKLQGGEPTLRPDLDRLAATAQELGMITAMATNGTIIPTKPEVINHIDEIILTLNSLNKDIQDDLRGEGSLQAILRTIEVARSKGVRVFNNMVVNKKNITELEPVFEYCEERGMTFHAQAVVFGRDFFDSSAKHLQLSPEETRTLHLRLAEWKRQGRNVLFSTSTYARAARWPDYDELNRQGTRPSACFAGREYVHIEPNGDVYPCNLHIGTFQAKNAVRDGITAALLHARRHRCQDCWHPYFNERKALFGLRWEAIKTSFRG